MAKKSVSDQAPVETVTPTVPASQPVSVAEIVQAAVAAALQNLPKQDNSDLAKAISEGSAAAIEAANPKPLTPGKRKQNGWGKTPFDAPAGKTKVLNHDYFQNDAPIYIGRVSFDECEMLNRIAKEVPDGKYCDNFITITKTDQGSGRLKVRINYPAKTMDDKNRAQKLGYSFTQRLNAIVLDAQAQKAARLARLKAELAEANASE